jgi:multimeric flavodoxin WrbA
MKILGIGGSPRKGGNTDLILQEILRGAGDAGHETEAVFLRDYIINNCTGCERCRKDFTCTRFSDGMDVIYPKVEEADVMILASPVYNYNVTAIMKSFIDRLYPYYSFSDDRPRRYGSRLADRKRGAVVFSVCEQTDPKEKGFAEEAMSRPFEALGYRICRSFPVCGFFDRRAVLRDEKVMEGAYMTGRNLSGERLC